MSTSGKHPRAARGGLAAKARSVEEARWVTCLTSRGARLSAAPTSEENRTRKRERTVLDPLTAVEHVLEGGQIAVEPSSLDFCVVTLDPGKGPIARDELHDSVPEDPVLITRNTDGECQVWYRRPKEPVRDGRWKHGRVACIREWVSMSSLESLARSVERGNRERGRGADLSRLPAAVN